MPKYTPIPGVSVVDTGESRPRSGTDPVQEFAYLGGVTDRDPREEVLSIYGELQQSGVDPGEAIAAPADIKPHQVSQPSSMDQLRSLARDLRQMNVPDREILKAIKQARISQLTSKSGGPNSYAALSPEEIEKLRLPKGTIAQINKNTGRVSVIRQAERDAANAREKIMRKLASGEGIISPGEQDVLLLNITDMIQREDVTKTVAAHNQRIRNAGAASKMSELMGNGPVAQAIRDAKTLPPLVALPRDPAKRVKGRRYAHPRDPNIAVLWDGEKVVSE